MAWSFVAVSTQVRAGTGGGDVTPTLPTGWAADDIHVCLIASRDNVASTMPAGWTAIDAGTNNGTGHRFTAFWRRAVGGDGDPLVTHTGGSRIVASIAGWRGLNTGAQPDATGTTKVNASSVTIAADAITTLAANALVVFLGSIIAGQTGGFTAFSGSPTPTLRLDSDLPPNANSPDITIADFNLAAAGTTGARQCTAVDADVNCGLLVSFAPPISIIPILMASYRRRRA